jgi:hypothetical protein
MKKVVMAVVQANTAQKNVNPSVMTALQVHTRILSVQVSAQNVLQTPGQTLVRAPVHHVQTTPSLMHAVLLSRLAHALSGTQLHLPVLCVKLVMQAHTRVPLVLEHVHLVVCIPTRPRSQLQHRPLVQNVHIIPNPLSAVLSVLAEPGTRALTVRSAHLVLWVCSRPLLALRLAQAAM